MILLYNFKFIIPIIISKTSFKQGFIGNFKKCNFSPLFATISLDHGILEYFTLDTSPHQIYGNKQTKNLTHICTGNFLITQEVVSVINQSEFYFQLSSDLYKVKKMKMLELNFPFRYIEVREISKSSTNSSFGINRVLA